MSAFIKRRTLLFFNRKVSQSKSQSSAKIYFKTLRNFAVHFSARRADKAQRVRLYKTADTAFFLTAKFRKVNRRVSQRYILKLCVTLRELCETLRSARRADKAQRVRRFISIRAESAPYQN
ncbi:MAG: hypothetical protein BWK80_11935 [Desulfobacteraceae bacterium IS3]|nr:MAG: hypothetical protein BWK80_11935 [Desulfobacteraceae bacterium IS3]